MDEGRKISFYSDAAHNYMVLECPPGLKDNYQYKMLAANRIRGLLSCSGRTIDSREYLYYDISSRQNLTDLYDRRPVRSGDLDRILEDLVRVEETLTEYLLDTSHLILDPECIYLDFREQSCSFAYYPGEEPEKGMEALFSFLADRVDGRDKQAAALIYRLCMMAEKPGFRLRAQVLKDLGMQIDKDKGTTHEIYGQAYDPVYEPVYEKERGIYGSSDRGQAAAFPEYDRPRTEDRADRNITLQENRADRYAGTERNTNPAGLILAAVLAAAGVLLVAADRYLEMEESQMILTRAFGAILLAAGAVLLIVRIVRNRRNHGEQNPEEEEFMSCTEPEPWENPAYYPAQRAYADSGMLQKVPPVKTSTAAPVFRSSYADSGMLQNPSSARETAAGPMFRSSSFAAPGETCLLGPETRPAAGLYGTGTCRGEQISLAKLPCVVGKIGDYVDQVLDDSSVSRMHARFSLDRDGQMTVRDLNSTNGTWLNGERLRPNESRQLQQGDHVRLGRMEFVFR